MRGVWAFAALALVGTATIAAMRLEPATDVPANIEAEMAVAVETPATDTEAKLLDMTPEPAGPWQEVRIRYGDTLGKLLDDRGLYSTAVRTVLQTDTDAQGLVELASNKTLRYRLTPAGELFELQYETNPKESIHLYKRSNGQYQIDKETRNIQTRLAYVSGTIDSSLFVAGQEAGLSDALIMRLTEIFGWDIDFAISLRKGDSFSVIHEEQYWLGQKIADGPILAAEFINRGEPYRAIGIRDDRGRLQYFKPDGSSMRRPFLRTPVEFSRISSRFGARRHPILGRWRQHRGVDYAAPRGTPIRATASGRVIHRGRKGGYGNTIMIQHGYGLTTLYGHMQRYRKGIRVGSNIEQGQIIGYVGSSGLATGPHLHYELRKRGKHQNPLRYRFPKADPIPGDMRPEFETTLANWTPRLDLMKREKLQLAGNP